MNQETRTSPAKILIGLLLIIGMTLTVIALKPTPTSTQAVPAELQAVLWPMPKPLQSFNLVDQQQQAFKLERLKGKWSFLFIGYTHCPDICPMALASINSTYNLLKQPEVIASTQVAFVSVDPDRDTPEHLASYIAYFNKDFIGATGTQADIDQFVKQLGAGYSKEPADESGSYQVSHTSSIFLINPAGEVAGAFSMPHDPKTIAAQYLQIRQL
jgi:protein SCO1/2